MTCACSQSCPTLVTPGTAAHQAPLSEGVSRQEDWRGLPFPSPRDLPDPETQPASPALAGQFPTTEPPGKSFCHTPVFKSDPRISMGWIKQKTFPRFRQKPMRCKDRQLKTCRARLKTPSPAPDREDTQTPEHLPTTSAATRSHAPAVTGQPCDRAEPLWVEAALVIEQGQQYLTHSELMRTGSHITAPRTL